MLRVFHAACAARKDPADLRLILGRYNRNGTLLHDDHSTGSHYITILFNGYSTSPCAPACFSLGMITRTNFSSNIVLIATQPGSLKSETVGRLRAGKICKTSESRSLWTFSINPTLPKADIAPSSSIFMLPSFSFFQGSSHAAQ